jgi:hypothetical protein
MATVTELKNGGHPMPVDNHGEFPRLPVRQARQGPLPYSQGKRAFYGILWAFWTAVLLIAGISAVAASSAGIGLLMLVLGIVTAAYDWRIWTWQAKHLWFLIIF